MTVGAWLAEAESKLKAAGIASARLDARVILEHYSRHSRAWLLAQVETVLPKPIKSQADRALSRRCKRVPLAYILGRREFYGLDFKVTPAVLIPRPETETLVETAVKMAPKQGKVLEIGTGSGAIAVSLKINRPDLEVMATDISSAALKVAKANARAHKIDINFTQSDLFDSISGNFDLILANLPYVPVGARRQAELNYEPDLALYGGPDGLDYYRRFLAGLNQYLLPNGQAVIEAGPTQRRQLSRMAERAGRKLQSASEYVSIIK